MKFCGDKLFSGSCEFWRMYWEGEDSAPGWWEGKEAVIIYEPFEQLQEGGSFPSNNIKSYKSESDYHIS